MLLVYYFRIGEVLVTKNPCLYPGDIRRLQAVDIPDLRPFIRDCIVFPVRGFRPHSNEISGSDLDGDQYWVYWGRELTVNQTIPPLAYTPASKKIVPEVTSELIINHILDILDDQTSGIISNTHSVVADKDPNGTKSIDCKYLAELFPRAIDSIKTGEQIDMEKVNQLREKYCKTYPKWMMKDDKESYKSESINGYLFNKVQNLRINGSEYRFTFKKYNQINKDILINIEQDDNANESLEFQNKTSRVLTFVSRNYYRFITTILCFIFYLIFFF
jgi:RNA-dependent RNA polymerase